MHLLLLFALAAQSPTLTPRDSAFHALNRLAYGARPGEADSVAQFGVMKWIERQLDADHVSDTRLAERERDFYFIDHHRAGPALLPCATLCRSRRSPAARVTSMSAAVSAGHPPGG